jgi:DNA-binding PadR family transcriptional regulator
VDAAARERPDLSPGEWAVLGTVGEGQVHGFAVSQMLGRGGPVGRVWSLPRPVVYQVIKKLQAMGLISAGGTVRSSSGPARTMLEITPAGRAVLDWWLDEPVDHVRDVRSMLLLKLAFLDRAGRDSSALVTAQRRRLESQVDSLAVAMEEAEGFDRVLRAWRLSGSRATLDFLDVLALPGPAVTEPPGEHRS